MNRLLIIATAALALTACGKQDNSAAKAGDDTSATPAEAVEAAAADADPMSDPDFLAQCDIARDFFNNAVLAGNDPMLVESYCTAGLCKKLKELNEYDTDDYALWYLRTGEQDGDGDSSVTEIIPDGTDSLIVKYLDMGHKGSTRLSFVKEDDTWKIASATSPMGEF